MLDYLYLIFLFETNAALVKYLISKGADVSIQDECGRTSLFLASELQSLDMIRYMETASCSVDTRFVKESFLHVILLTISDILELEGLQSISVVHMDLVSCYIGLAIKSWFGIHFLWEIN